MTEPSVTICMATYNGERFVAEQIRSIVAQDYPHWRLLVHDDGSTDKTVAILEAFAASDSRIQVVSGLGHLGIKKGFMTLLGIEQSDFYAFCDQDDVWQPNKLTKMIGLLTAVDSSQPALGYSDFTEIDATGRDITDYERVTPFETKFEDLLIANTATGCTCVMNRALRDSIVATLATIDYSAMHMHDWWAVLVAAGTGRVVYTRERLVAYRQHHNNVLGAAGKGGLQAQLRRVCQFGEREQLAHIATQAKMLQTLYASKLGGERNAFLDRVATLWQGYQPIAQLSFLSKQHLFAATHSKTSVIQMVLLLFTPTKKRSQILALSELGQ
ncbi:glycosyltransferase family 2 protein [Lacticaseibacillus suibinensis]|uniref:glycosyltransferase family 2 protein n=1 Tax=Lacticaseibacillus suibinensis TaxID=2486011 RepID=UPI0019441044|nr:glycosyltransferase family 2 protein [Lacticaseibacillus suibinensis]